MTPIDTLKGSVYTVDNMHPIQKKLLELSQIHDLNELGLRQITRMVGEKHPQKIKYHLQKLGFLEYKPGTSAFMDKARLVPIPLRGMANCGEASIYADTEEKTFINVSERVLPRTINKLYALETVGDSMNKANINGNSIDDGDFVIVDPESNIFENGDYVVSIINNMANIKKFYKDDQNKQIILLSESLKKYPPIYIHEDEMSHYMTSGKVLAVLKNPK